MNKKLAGLIGAGALLLSVTGGAFAYWFGGDYAFVSNSSSAVANTGENQQLNYANVEKAHVWGEVEVRGADNDVDTGNATAYSGALVVANTHVGCSLCDFGGGWNKAFVSNTSDAGANSGVNDQVNYADVHKAGVWGEVEVKDVSNDADTGDAEAESHAWTVVNTHWTGWGVY